MSAKEMFNKLEKHNGVGILATFCDGNSVHYFYEDFSDDDKGIDRAIGQMLGNPRIVSFTVYDKKN